jgi:type IV pilus assembly protein PilW
MMRSPKHQAGLSLLELMVAMIIGLFIIVGISSVYLGNKRSNITTNELSLLQDNGRAILEQLTEVIQHTGYSSTSAAPTSEVFITSAVANSSCSDGSDNVLDTSMFSPMANNTAYGDTVGVIYLGDDLLNTDCGAVQLPASCRMGSGATSAAARIYNYFYVAPDAGGVPELRCSGSRNTAAQTIAQGVENLQLTYGEDNNADGTPDRYVSSANVTSWGSVVSVNIAVLVRSLRPIAVANEARSYRLSEDAIINTNDRYLRAVFTTTIRLRNVTL